jgi:hypothetical protein
MFHSSSQSSSSVPSVDVDPERFQHSFVITLDKCSNDCIWSRKALCFFSFFFSLV